MTETPAPAPPSAALNPADLLVFLDLETTGLDPTRDRILEVGIVVLTKELVSPLPPGQDNALRTNIVTYLHPEDLVPDPFVRQMHADSGLLAEVCKTREDFDAHVQGKGVAGVYDACEPRALSFLRRFGFTAGTATLCGFGPHFDLGFLKVHMPMLARMFGYRLIDVTALLELDARWGNPNVREDFKKQHEAQGLKKHRALEDCKAAAQVLDAYRVTWPNPAMEDTFLATMRSVAGLYAATAGIAPAIVAEPAPETAPGTECLSCGGSGVDIMADGSSRTCHCRAVPAPQETP